MIVRTLALLCTVLLAATGFGQPQLPQPQPSPRAEVVQTVGISTVKVTYNRPGVKGREVWGKLVPYNEVWRAGANENTTVEFSHDVRIEGMTLAAGTYGLHMIPMPTSWVVIFSRNATSWGSYHYKQDEDALRVTVSPQAGEHTEWLSFGFGDLTDRKAVLSLAWEKIRVPISIEFDTPRIVVAYARDVYLRGGAGFSWSGPHQAALWCLRNNIELEQGLKWAELSTQRAENFTNLRTRAGLLEKLGRREEAQKIEARAMKVATEADMNALGYEFMNAGKMKEAIITFQKNVQDYPDSWNVYDSLAEAFENHGDIQKAIANYEKALARVEDEENRKRISDKLKELRK